MNIEKINFHSNKLILSLLGSKIQSASKLPTLKKSLENFPVLPKISFLKVKMFIEYIAIEKTVRLQRCFHLLNGMYQELL